MKDRWKVLDSIITDIVKDGGVLDRYISEQVNSAKDYCAVWGVPYSPNKLSGFDEEAAFLRTWLKERQTWINSNIDEKLTHAYVTVTFESDGEVVGSCTVPGGTDRVSFPSLPYDENRQLIGWEDQNGEAYDINKKIIEDTVFTAR